MTLQETSLNRKEMKGQNFCKNAKEMLKKFWIMQLHHVSAFRFIYAVTIFFQGKGTYLQILMS